MKDYYQILRIRRGASASEIRRAYRILVQQLHPDVNPDPTAHELIKEVNEAYDVLGDEVKKKEYDYRFENPYTEVFTPPQPTHRDPRYKGTGASRPYVHVNRQTSQYDLMNRYGHFAMKVFWSGLALFAILLMDLALPHRVIEDRVSTFDYRNTGRYRSEYLITEGGEVIKIVSNDFEVGQSIEIVKSRLLSIVIEVRIPEYQLVTNNLSTIFANFKFVFWILGVFSIAGVLAKGAVVFRFNLGIMTFFVLIFTVYLLIK